MVICLLRDKVSSTGRRIFGDGRTGTYGRPLPTVYRSNQLRIRTDECVVFDDGAEFICAVVVTGDGASAMFTRLPTVLSPM